MQNYRHRLVDPLLDELLATLPAVLLVGPRACGKTTTAVSRATTVLRMDRPSSSAAVANDPDAVLATCDPPVLIDEWQLAPQILGAVKRDIDSHSSTGKFLLTGSSRADLQAEGWPATGRIVRVQMWPMTVRERVGNTMNASIIDTFFEANWEAIKVPSESIDVRGYIDLALQGGFPELVDQVSERSRRAWLSSYLEQTVLRDAPFASQERDPKRLRAYLQAIAANSAAITAHKTLYDAAAITRLTAQSYDGLLESLFVTEQIPAWSTNRLSRLVRASKRHIIEPAIAASLLRLDARTIVRDAILVGSFIDTFVTAQLRSEVGIATSESTMFHLRQLDGSREVDLLLEGPGGQLVAMEIKAHAAPDLAMAKHLCWLRDALPDKFTLGVVFHTGPRAYILDERIWAVPISAIWA